MAESTAVRRRNWTRGRDAAISFLEMVKRTAAHACIEGVGRPGSQPRYLAALTPQLALLAPHAAEGFEAVITDFLGMAYEAGAADPASYRNWTFEDWLGTADTQGAVSWNEVRHA